MQPPPQGTLANRSPTSTNAYARTPNDQPGTGTSSRQTKSWTTPTSEPNPSSGSKATTGSRLENSPAWRLIGYGAVAGFRDRQPYGVLVHNSLPRSNHLAHFLICEPAAHRLHELFLRAADRRWLSRTYKPVNEGDVDDAGKFGVEGLLQAGADRTSFKQVTTFEGIIGDLLQAIQGEPAARL